MRIAILWLIGVFLQPAVHSKERTPADPKQDPPFQGASRIKCPLSSATITIDGAGDEWESVRAPVINKNTALACRRDADSLYVHLLTSDPEFSMQMMNFGLTLWLDSRGSRKKTVGVQFPLIQIQPPPPREGGTPPKGEELKKFLDARLKEIVVEFPGKKDMKQMSLAEANKHGIAAAIGVDTEKGAICYELKYPLRKSPSDGGMGLDLKGRKHLDICVETPEIDPSRLKPEEGEPQSPAEGAASKRDIRPPKPSEGPKPPKPTKKPPDGRISQWIRTLL